MMYWFFYQSVRLRFLSTADGCFFFVHGEGLFVANVKVRMAFYDL